jgi:RluA family pseudouridine synthase
MQRPEILFEDHHILVVAKPAGLLTVPDRYVPDAPNLVTWLKRERSDVFVVHRLDRDTSGLVLLALTPDAHRVLSVQFTNRQVRKQYLALVDGSPAWDDRTLDLPLRADADRRHRTRVDPTGGKDARTHVTVVERFDSYALVQAVPETGRTHQIRVHLAEAGHPIVSDPLYGDGEPLFLSSFKRRYKPGRHEERPLVGRTALHASELSFTHPATGEMTSYSAPLPRDMNAAVRQLARFGANASHPLRNHREGL